jgi:Phage integrase family
VPRDGKEGEAWNREHLQQIDLRFHDLRHEGASRLLADGVDIRIIQLMLGHASVQQTQRYLNVTDEELRKGLEVSWKTRAGRCGWRRDTDASSLLRRIVPILSRSDRKSGSPYWTISATGCSWACRPAKGHENHRLCRMAVLGAARSRLAMAPARPSNCLIRSVRD